MIIVSEVTFRRKFDRNGKIHRIFFFLVVLSNGVLKIKSGLKTKRGKGLHVK